MIDKIFKDKNTRKFIFIAFGLLLLALTIEKINGRFWLNDFKVMYLAAKALLANEQVYGVSFGLSTGFYKYSPFTLFLFVPSTYLSFEVASVIHYLLISIAVIGTIIFLEQIISEYLLENSTKYYLTFLAIFLCILNHLVRELHLGNTNIMLLFLVVLSLKLVLKSKHISGGLLIAIIVFTKPYFVVCFLPLLLYKNKKVILSSMGWAVLFMAFSIVVLGFSNTVTLHSQWLGAMLEHSNYLTSDNTIFSLIYKYFGISIQASYSIILLLLIGVLSLVYFWIQNKKNAESKNPTIVNQQSLLLNVFLLVAIVPNVLITDTEHFLFSLPLIVILILLLKKNKKPVWISLFIITIFMYGGGSSDIVGHKIADIFQEYGVLGISNLFIVGSVYYLYSRKTYLFKS